VQDTLCRDQAPPLRELAPGHTVACHWAEQIKAGELKPKQRVAEIVEPVPQAGWEPPPT
jgi:peptide/nickel transport system ATP-binding protein